MSADSKKLEMEISSGEISPCLQDESNGSTVENAKKKKIFDKYLSRFSFTKRGKLMLLVLTILCLVLLIVVIALAGAWPRWPRFIGNTCDKPSCLIASAQMLQSAELSSGACEDPWVWACGGWQDNNIAKTIWSYKDELDYRETVRVRNLIGSLPAGLPGSTEWILAELYNSCAATDNIEVESDLPLKKIIRDLDGWHVLRNWSLLRWELRAALSRIHSRYGARPYFDVSVRQGPCNQGLANYQTNNDNFASVLPGCIVLNPPKLGLPHRELYYKMSDHPITLAYKRMMRDVTTMLGATSTDATQFSDDQYYYERRLAETASSLGDIDSDTDYELVTLQQLQSAAPQLPVYDVLTSMFPRAKIKLSTQILVPSLKYARRLSELISTSDRGPINNYMMWSLTLAYLPYLSSPYRTAYRDFQQALTSPRSASTSSNNRQSYPSFPEPTPPRWYECAKVVREWAGPILENQESSVETKTSTELEKSEPRKSNEVVRWLFVKIRDAVIDAVLKSEHITGERQREAVRKLKTMTLQIGAPAETHVNAYRERFYRDFAVLRNAFFENAIAANEQNRAIMENTLISSSGTQVAQDSALSMLKFMVKMPLSVRFYEQQRVITVPLSILQQPHFHIDHPMSLQVARLGVPIAEALFSGIFKIIADNDTDAFLHCFSKHIPVISGRKGTSLKNAAIHLAAVKASRAALNKIEIQAEYDANSNEHDKNSINNINNQAKTYDRSKKEFQHGLGEMNSRQLFTLAYAQTMCSKSTSEMEQLSPLIKRKLTDYDLFMLSWSRVKDLRKSMGCKLLNFDACLNLL